MFSWDVVGGVVGVTAVLVFFFKQKTAYEMLRSLVGSEMCIRDSSHIGCRPRRVPHLPSQTPRADAVDRWRTRFGAAAGLRARTRRDPPVSYTHLTLPTIYSV